MEDIDPRLSVEEAKEIYEAQIKRELEESAQYHEALKDEFKDASPDDPDTAIKAGKRLMELVPDAGTQIKYLINHAESEAVRKDLAKWVFQTAMRAAEINDDEDAMQKLVNSLTKAST